MQDAIVIYNSKYGSTRQYAEWIGESLKADVVPASEATPNDLRAHKIVVFGTYVHIGKMVGIGFLADNYKSLLGKGLIIFSVSGTPAGHPDLLANYESQVPKEIRDMAQYFQLGGRAGKLDFADSMLMLFPKLAAYIRYQRSKDPQDRQDLEHLNGFDSVSKESIGPIIDAVKKLRYG